MSSFCLGCGSSMTEGERYCSVCGRDSQATASSPRIDPGVAFGLAPETSGKAIFSLIASFFIIILPFSIVAVVFGHVALADIRKSGGRLTGRGIATIGIVLGYLGAALFCGLMGLGIYEDRTARKARAHTSSGGIQVNRNSKTYASMGSDTSAVSVVRTLNMAEIAYSQSHRESGFTCSLSELGETWGIGSGLATAKRNGYVFELKGCISTKSVGPVKKYQVVAYPSGLAKKGSPAYCSDQSDVIRVARSGSADDCLGSGIELSDNEITHPQQW